MGYRIYLYFYMMNRGVVPGACDALPIPAMKGDDIRHMVAATLGADDGCNREVPKTPGELRRAVEAVMLDGGDEEAA